MRNDILERKMARLIVALAEELHIPEDRALNVFYLTDVYRQLTDFRTGLRLMSDGYILDDLRLATRRFAASSLSSPSSNSVPNSVPKIAR